MEARFQLMDMSRLQEKVLQMLYGMTEELEYGLLSSDEDITDKLVELPCALCILIDRQRAEKAKRNEVAAVLSEQSEAAWRRQIETSIQGLSFSNLEHYVLTRKPHWEFAKQVLRHRRAAGQNVGHMPPPPPPPDRAAPHNPDGTEGDYWRIKSG